MATNKPSAKMMPAFTKCLTLFGIDFMNNGTVLIKITVDNSEIAKDNGIQKFRTWTRKKKMNITPDTVEMINKTFFCII